MKKVSMPDEEPSKNRMLMQQAQTQMKKRRENQGKERVGKMILLVINSLSLFFFKTSL